MLRISTQIRHLELSGHTGFVDLKKFLFDSIMGKNGQDRQPSAKKLPGSEFRIAGWMSF
jgi:hypothetical protein